MPDPSPSPCISYLLCNELIPIGEFGPGNTTCPPGYTYEDGGILGPQCRSIRIVDNCSECNLQWGVCDTIQGPCPSPSPSPEPSPSPSPSPSPEPSPSPSPSPSPEPNPSPDPNQCLYSFIESVGNKIRFFNQPIEQIPVYKCDMPQILTHGPGCGLSWFTLDQCLDVVTCLSLQSDRLKVTRNKVVVLKDFGSLSGPCDITMNECGNPFNPDLSIEPSVSPSS